MRRRAGLGPLMAGQSTLPPYFARSKSSPSVLTQPRPTAVRYQRPLRYLPITPMERRHHYSVQVSANGSAITCASSL